MTKPHRFLLLTAALLLAAGGCTSTRSGDAMPTAPPGASSTSRPVPTNDGDDSVVNPPTVQVDPDAVDVATRFGRAWARPATAKKKWLATLKPLASDRYLQLLRTVDPGRVPASAVTGPSRVTTSTTSTTVVQLPTDAGTLNVTVIKEHGRWKVATVDMAAS